MLTSIRKSIENVHRSVNQSSALSPALTQVISEIDVIETSAMEYLKLKQKLLTAAFLPLRFNSIADTGIPQLDARLSSYSMEQSSLRHVICRIYNGLQQYTTFLRPSIGSTSLQSPTSFSDHFKTFRDSMTAVARCFITASRMCVMN